MSSVPDLDPNPDPDPPDPHVFGPPGSGSWSISQRYGSGSFYHQAKILRKTLISTVLWLLYDFLSLKNDVNVPSKKGKKPKTQKKNYISLSIDHQPWQCYQFKSGTLTSSSTFQAMLYQIITRLLITGHNCIPNYHNTLPGTSVADPWHFGMDPDPDPPIHASD